MPGVTLRPKSNLQGNRCKPVPFFYVLKKIENPLDFSVATIYNCCSNRKEGE
jgi:hypothetical protein